jgi:hypothetical protein
MADEPIQLRHGLRTESAEMITGARSPLVGTDARERVGHLTEPAIMPWTK